MSFLKDMPDADLKLVLRREPDLGALYAGYHQVLMRGPSPFSEGERELIGAYVSGLNACDFCYGEHAGIAEAFRAEGAGGWSRRMALRMSVTLRPWNGERPATNS